MVKIPNVRIMDLIHLLARLSLKYDAVDLVLDPENNRVLLDPVLPPGSDKEINEVHIKDDDIKDLI